MRLRDEVARRIHPRLRMIYNGDEVVNGRRAEQSTVVTMAAPPVRAPGAQQAADTTVGACADSRKLPEWESPAKGVMVSTFVEVESESDSGNDNSLESHSSYYRGGEETISSSRFPGGRLEGRAPRSSL